MAFLLILITLLLQRILMLPNYLSHLDLFESYFTWMEKRFDQTASWSAWSGVLLNVLPVLILAIIIMAVVYHLFGFFIYALVSLFVLWYYMDAHPLRHPKSETALTKAWWYYEYQSIFALIFWFTLMGAVGVILYTLVVSLKVTLSTKTNACDRVKSLHKAATECQGLLDWLPVKLFELTLCILGTFSVTFPIFRRSLFSGIEGLEPELINLVQVNLALESSDMEVPPSAKVLKLINTYINRILVVWLVVIALFTLGRWLG